MRLILPVPDLNAKNGIWKRRKKEKSAKTPAITRYHGTRTPVRARKPHTSCMRRAQQAVLRILWQAADSSCFPCESEYSGQTIVKIE